MQFVTLAFALISVFLTATAQLLLKTGMTQATTAPTVDGSLSTLALTVLSSPYVLAGLACFICSTFTWLAVLARIDVSQAYPFVSLGIVLTILGGHYFLGESVSAIRLIGGGIIVFGVLLVAWS